MAFFIGVFMTVSVSERLSPLYEGNGTNTRFDFTFRVFDQEDANGVSVKHQVGADFENVDESLYSVTINPDNLGGYINFLTPPEVGFEFYIAGETPVDQLLDITNYDNFYPDAIERSLDKLTAILQERAHSLGLEKLSRDKALQILDLAIQERIKEQGLALDQIDSFAKDLANRLTNIVIEKGWLAELIADGIENQKQINDKNIQEVQDVSALRQLIVRKDGQLVRTNYHTKEGFGGGIYRFELLSSKPDNNGAWIASSVTAGTWILQDNLKFEHFGVTDNDIDQSTKVQKCIDFALANAITRYGFEKAFKCRIDNTIVFNAIPDPQDWGMPTDRTEVTMAGASFVSTVNNLTYIRILRDRVEFKDTLAVDGKGSIGQIGIALGYEKTDDPMDTSLRRSACFMVLNGYFPANIDIGIKSNIPRSINGSAYGMYNHKVFNFDARHVNIGWYADKGFADDPVTNKLTRTRVFGFGHIDGSCSFYMLACESFKCYGYSGEHLKRDDARLPDGKAVAWYSPEKSNPIDTYQNSYNYISGFIEQSYREYVNQSPFFTWDVQSWFTETSNDVAKQGVAELSLSKMGIGSNGTFIENKSVKDFHFKNGGFRTAVVSITSNSQANASLPDFYKNKDFYGNVQWLPMANDFEDSGLLILTDFFYSDGGFRQFVSQYRNGAWSPWGDLSYKYGIGNNDISIINKSLDTFKFVSGGVRFAQVTITGEDEVSGRSCPNGSYFYGAIQWIQTNETEGKQIAYSTAPGSNSSRSYVNGTWTNWVDL